MTKKINFRTRVTIKGEKFSKKGTKIKGYNSGFIFSLPSYFDNKKVNVFYNSSLDELHIYVDNLGNIVHRSSKRYVVHIGKYLIDILNIKKPNITKVVMFDSYLNEDSNRILIIYNFKEKLKEIINYKITKENKIDNYENNNENNINIKNNDCNINQLDSLKNCKRQINNIVKLNNEFKLEVKDNQLYITRIIKEFI